MPGMEWLVATYGCTFGWGGVRDESGGELYVVASGCRGGNGGERGAEWWGLGRADVEGGGDRRGSCRGVACAAGALNKL
jgi:hypothetical protein